MFFIIHAVVFISLMCTIQCDANFNEIYLSIINTILYRNYSIQDPNIKFENEICHKFVSDFTISNWVKILLCKYSVNISTICMHKWYNLINLICSA